MSQKKSVKVWCLALSAILLVSFLGACGGGNAPAAPAAPAASAAPGAAPAAPGSAAPGSAAAPAADAAAVDNSIVRVARAEDVTYWDPLDHVTLVMWSIARSIYDQLLGKTVDGEIYGRLAESWEISDDQLSWTFKIKEGVKFHNGEDLTAHDVKFTFDRFLNENLRQDANWMYLKSAEVISDYEVKINLTDIDGTFLNDVVDLSILPMDTFNEMGKDAFFTVNIGSGPYKFVEHVVGEKIVMDRYDDYWGEKGIAGRIEYYCINDDATRVSAIMAGTIDAVAQLPSDQIPIIEANTGLSVSKFNAYDAIYLGFKCDTGPLANANARHAVNVGIDRQEIVDYIIQGGRASTWPVADGCVGGNPSAPSIPRDVEAAKQYLAASGYNGEEIRLVAPTTWYAKTKEVTQAMESQLEEVGFNVTIEMVDGATFTDRRAAGDYEIYYTGCGMLGGDPATYMAQRLVQDTMGSGHTNQALKDAVIASEHVADPAERNKAVQDAFQIMVDSCEPHTFVFQWEEVQAKKANLVGETAYYDKTFDYSYIHFE